MALILCDMDGVLADWGAAYDEGLDRYGTDGDGIPRHLQQRSFDLFSGITEYEKHIVREVMANLNYRTLKPLPGGPNALRAMRASGHEVMICTSPWLPNRNCIPDKIDWVREHLGESWAERIVITKDKTVMLGDVLIDDKPNITGHAVPTWRQVIFDQPYNREVQDKPRIHSWSEWSDELLETRS